MREKWIENHYIGNVEYIITYDGRRYRLYEEQLGGSYECADYGGYGDVKDTFNKMWTDYQESLF